MNENRSRGILLDPRTKLLLLVTITTLMLSTSNEGWMNVVKPILSLVPFVFLISERQFKTAGKYLVLYAVCFVLEHVTEKIVIPMSVIFRFFPTIAEEYRSINDAMRMRGIRFGGKNPFRMIEYRLVPLMVSVVKIGDELSAAALTRGLGAPNKRTNICKIGFHVQDIIAILLCVACFGLFFFQRQIPF